MCGCGWARGGKKWRTGAKNGVRMRAPHITIFVRYAFGCRPKSLHTKGLVNTAFSISVYFCFFPEVKKSDQKMRYLGHWLRLT